MGTTGTPEPPEEASRIYAVRIVSPARADIDEAHAHFAQTAGQPVADQWQDGLFAAIRQLATMPRKQAIAPENRYFPEEVRQLVYWRRRGSVAYRVLFSIAQNLCKYPVTSPPSPSRKGKGGEKWSVLLLRFGGARGGNYTGSQEGDDPPFVRILHVRHGARRPMTRAEVQQRRRAIEEEA